MLEDQKDVTAGDLPPGDGLYEVTDRHKHPSLKNGDVVKIVEGFDGKLMLVRTDFTAHRLRDEYDQYVHLLPVQPNDDEISAKLERMEVGLWDGFASSEGEALKPEVGKSLCEHVQEALCALEQVDDYEIDSLRSGINYAIAKLRCALGTA